MGEGQAQFLLAHSHPATPLRLVPALFSSVLVGADALVPVTAPGIVAVIDRNGGDSSAHPFITYSEDSGLGRLLSQHLTTFWKITGLELLLTSHHAGVPKAMAVDGRGLAWLPRSLIPAEVDRGDLVPVGGSARSTIALEIRLFRPTARLCAIAESFWVAASADGDKSLRSAPPVANRSACVIPTLDHDPKL